MSRAHFKEEYYDLRKIYFFFLYSRKHFVKVRIIVCVLYAHVRQEVLELLMQNYVKRKMSYFDYLFTRRNTYPVYTSSICTLYTCA